MADLDPQLQYLRTCTLLVSNRTLNALDLSQFRIKFVVKRSDTMTPNVADIRVYNLSAETALVIQKEFTQVTLQAGYQGNYGVIFQGNIKQVIIGRESAQDTFIDIIAGDGDRAYNFAVVNTSLAKGATQMDQAKASIAAMSPKGVTAGILGDMGTTALPRGKSMFGNSRNYLRDISQTQESSWSIQDEKVTFVKKKVYLPGEAVVLTSKTGMIGTPQQTTQGINIKCLLNPNIRISTRVKIDNRSVENFKLNLSVIQTQQNTPVPLTDDGVYYVLVVEHTGDTRGVEWYSSLVCLNIDVTTNPLNSVGNNG